MEVFIIIYKSVVFGCFDDFDTFVQSSRRGLFLDNDRAWLISSQVDVTIDWPAVRPSST
ncbi:hypothetical protein BDB00DRAFT_803381 [Zychaea mexicana]|uniref:uncharacterized protein n=1 Tax=Zychaea mexicana TaxID=64656 RepID=UPI0022FE5AB6|nr:uncharacterized protein BDB00DRAFT_803381 [Zychaea mexicana]KAI9497618.1 hypothetical protein BDB00DRAFT_803381 [Zychaea mexicana]